ncbi:hypothetical protein C8J57DRAFT_1221566 [Mycena rebaudengoi]|nr:hypothetical protein C8J57DRAFT_1221566 [Mycena rebaudengoi]
MQFTLASLQIFVLAGVLTLQLAAATPISTAKTNVETGPTVQFYPRTTILAASAGQAPRGSIEAPRPFHSGTLPARQVPLPQRYSKQHTKQRWDYSFNSNMSATVPQLGADPEDDGDKLE